MRRMQKILTTLAAAGMLVFAGCSSSGEDVETMPDPEGTITFQVENNLAPAQSVIVTFHATGDVERSLGSVGATETRTFVVENRFALPPYYLVAEGSGGEDRISRQIETANADVVEWDLATNLIQIDDN